MNPCWAGHALGDTNIEKTQDWHSKSRLPYEGRSWQINQRLHHSVIHVSAQNICEKKVWGPKDNIDEREDQECFSWGYPSGNVSQVRGAQEGMQTGGFSVRGKNVLSFVNTKPSTLGNYNLIVIAKDRKAIWASVVAKVGCPQDVKTELMPPGSAPSSQKSKTQLCQNVMGGWNLTLSLELSKLSRTGKCCIVTYWIYFAEAVVSPELKELSAQVSEPKVSNPASETKLEQSKHTIPAQKGCFQVENLGVNCMSFNILKLEKICKKCINKQ